MHDGDTRGGYPCIYDDPDDEVGDGSICPPDIVVMLSQRFVVDFSRRDVRLLATVLADRIPVCEAVFGRAVF